MMRRVVVVEANNRLAAGRQAKVTHGALGKTCLMYKHREAEARRETRPVKS